MFDLIHKSHNAPVPYPTMHHSEQKCVHFYSEWCIAGYAHVHCGICEIGLLERDTPSAHVTHTHTPPTCLNTLMLRQSGHHFANDVFHMLFFKACCILIETSLKFYPSGSIDIISSGNGLALHRGQVITWTNEWCSLLTHICVTRSRWVKLSISCLLTA